MDDWCGIVNSVTDETKTRVRSGICIIYINVKNIKMIKKLYTIDINLLMDDPFELNEIEGDRP